MSQEEKENYAKHSHHYVVNFRTFGTFAVRKKKFEINEHFLAISVRKENRLNP